jgi:hypothetical protein
MDSRSAPGSDSGVDRSALPRWIEIDGDKSDAEAKLQVLAPSDLEELFGKADGLD